VQPNAPLDTDVAIETPEHIVFRHRLAGPARRLLAYSIDLLICYSAFAAVALVVAIAAMGVADATGAAKDAVGAGVGVLMLLLFAIQWVYFAVLEAWRGTTPGKFALGCRVVTTWGRRLGDLVAGTMVIVPERARAAAPLVLWPAAQPQELAQLADADVKLDADERLAIEMFLRRRKRLGPAREFELAAMISSGIAARFGLQLSDPSRALALLYDRAANAGRADGPVSSRPPGPWR
jgi:uncharacterized RDD family membrane protein YckC